MLLGVFGIDKVSLAIDEVLLGVFGRRALVLAITSPWETHAVLIYHDKELEKLCLCFPFEK